MLKILLYIFVAAITPGPNNILVLTGGLKHGYKKTLPFIFGVCVFISIALVLTTLFGQNLNTYKSFNFVVALFGSFYLAYLSLKLFKAGTGIEIDESKKEHSFLEAVILQFVNPKVWVFLTTLSFLFFPHGTTISYIFYISIMSFFINYFALSVWALLGDKLKHWFDNTIFAKLFYWGNGIILLYLTYDIVKEFILPFLFK